MAERSPVYLQRAWREPGLWTLAARIFLGAIFLYAGVAKVADPSGFAEAVYNYQILPDSLVNLTALLLPWVEVVLGVCLVLGIFAQGVALLATFLLSLFFAAVAFNLARGLDIHCGCFSTSAEEGGSMRWVVVRDAFFLLPAFYLLRRNLSGESSRRMGRRGR